MICDCLFHNGVTNDTQTNEHASETMEIESGSGLRGVWVAGGAHGVAPNGGLFWCGWKKIDF